MANDVKAAIQEKIRKLRMLEELADDPDALAMLRDMLGNNNGANPAAAPARPALETVTTQTRLAIGDSMGPGPARGEQLATVEEVLASTKEPVTTNWIFDQMVSRGFQFKASAPKVAINECLRTLRERNKARIVKTLGVENYWEYIAQ